MLHIEKNYYSSSTICKKSQVDIFKITPTGRSQKRIIKKKHSVDLTKDTTRPVENGRFALACDRILSTWLKLT